VLIVLLLAGLVTIALVTLWVMQRTTTQPVQTPSQNRSPAPWIADSVWRALKPQGTLSRRGVIASYFVSAPELIPTTDNDRRRVPVAVVPEDVPVPPAGDWQAQLERLKNTPGRTSARRAVWPYCCERLATLLSCQGKGDSLNEIEAMAGSLDRAFLEGEINRWGGPSSDREALRATGWRGVLGELRMGVHSGTGINIFQCRACGAVFVASCAP